MKKINIKKFIVSTLVFIVVMALFAIGVLYALSPEVWYAGEHDSQCEGFDEEAGISCHCYERLVKAAYSDK